MLALRPARPGVHVFSIYNSDEDKHDNDPADDLVLSTLPHSSLRLSAPNWGPRVIGTHLDNRKEYASWTCNNPSTYLIDTGLWTACKESRFIIEREFRSRKWELAWRHHCDGQNPSQFYGYSHLVPAMACFKHKDSPNHHYLTVFPKEDLFYLQPHDIETLDWDGMQNRYFLGESLGFNHPGNFTLGFYDLTNIALEFDPSWAIGVENARPHSGGDQILDLLAQISFDGGTYGGMCMLWLIDYGLKRKPNVPMNEALKGKSVFYQGNRRFVEVDTCGSYPESDEWDCYKVDDCVISCARFIGKIDDRMRSWGREECGYLGDSPANIGTLACEYY